MSALKGIVEKLGNLGYSLEESMSLKVQDAIEIIDDEITKENYELDRCVESHIEFLGDIARDIQIFVDAPDGTEVIDMDCKEE